MWSKLVAQLTCYALARVNLSVEDRNKVVVHILDSLSAMPLHDIIVKNEGGELTINGKHLDMEQATLLREAATVALNNKALNLIREQVVYETFVGAAFKSANPTDFLFGRAALWWGERVQVHLETLAQKKEPDLYQDY